MGSKEILLIEDDPEISKAVAFRLSKNGYEVTVAEDGEKGLAWALTHVPSLIVLDLFLPGMSGEEVCKAIREHDDAAIEKIPIIMLTAKSMISDRIVGKVIGASIYMTKPFEMDQLLTEIHKLTGNGTVRPNV